MNNWSHFRIWLGAKKASIIACVITVLVAVSISYISHIVSEGRKYKLAQKEARVALITLNMIVNDNNGISPKEFNFITKPITDFNHIDPWGNNYMYYCPGKVHPTGFDIVSLGRDGQVGGKGWDADIVVGLDGTLPVNLQKNMTITCSKCGKMLRKETTLIVVSYNEAKKYESAGSDKTIEEKMSSGYCTSCNFQIMASTQVFNLINKTRKEILAAFGTPYETRQSRDQLGIFKPELYWKFENKPNHYETRVYFCDSKLSKVGLVQVNFTDDQGWNGPDLRVSPTQIIPSEIWDKNPAYIRPEPFYKRARIGWYIGKTTYIAWIFYPDIDKETMLDEIKIFNEKTGQTTYDYKVSPRFNWRSGGLVAIIQQINVRLSPDYSTIGGSIDEMVDRR